MRYTKKAIKSCIANFFCCETVLHTLRIGSLGPVVQYHILIPSLSNNVLELLNYEYQNKQCDNQIGVSSHMHWKQGCENDR